MQVVDPQEIIFGVGIGVEVGVIVGVRVGVKVGLSVGVGVIVGVGVLPDREEVGVGVEIEDDEQEGPVLIE